MAINPYQAPTATTIVGAPAASGDGFNGQIAALPAGAGAAWLSAGLEIFKTNPGVWIAIAVAFFVFSLGVNLIPLAGGLVWSVLMPLLIGGMMVGCDALRRGEGLAFSHLFEGFNRKFGPLALIGAIYLGCVIALVAVLGIGAALLIPLLGMDLQQLLAGGDNVAQLPLLVALFTLVVVAVTLPLVMATWFAPSLVVLDDLPAIEAMKQSFLGCLRNIVPFLVYGAIGLVLSILATLPLMLGWLVLGPVLIGSTYAAYRGIYCGD